MKYGLEQFKQVADELLGALTPGAQLRAQIVLECKQSGRNKRLWMRTWPMYAAAGLLACAVIVLALSVMLNQTSPGDSPGGQLLAQQTLPATTGEPSFGTAVIVGTSATDDHYQQVGSTTATASYVQHSASDAALKAEADYRIMQHENGLYGLMDVQDEWVVEPLYDKGELNELGAIFWLNGETVEFPFDGL